MNQLGIAGRTIIAAAGPWPPTIRRFLPGRRLLKLRMPKWVENAITAVSPSWALRRQEARTQVARASTVKNLYEGASFSAAAPPAGGHPLTDANAETRVRQSLRLRAVARDLRRNSALATKACLTITANVVGAGITPTVRAATDTRQKAVSALIKRHFESTDCDADGRHNLYGLQALAMSAIVESGEVLIRRRIRRPSDGYALPFQIQVLESDFLDTNVDGQLPNGNFAAQGIEFDLRGQRVAYYLFPVHPGSISLGQTAGYRGQRVSADFVSHIYRVDRPGMVRGVSWFAPVIVRLKDFQDYIDAQLLRQKIAACFGAFVQTQDGAAPEYDEQGRPLQVSPSGLTVEGLEPGAIQYLREGETITFPNPPTVQDFDAYSRVTLREIAAGLGVTYEALTGDLGVASYSGGRLGHLEFDRYIDQWRWQMLIPQMMDPVQAWTQDAVAAVTGSTEPFNLSWTPPERILIDPSTENDASKEAIRNGLSSRSEEIRKRGLDPEALDREIFEDNKRADELGLIFDSDARQVSGRGVSQKADAAPPPPGSAKARNKNDSQSDEG